MSKKKLTEAQRAAKRERDRRYRERKRAAKNKAYKPLKTSNAKVKKIAANAKMRNASPMEMVAAGLSVIAAALTIAARQSK